MNTQQVNITKNSYPLLDSNHQHRTPCFPACPSNYSAIGTVEEMWLKPLQYLFTLRYYKISVWYAKGYIENKNNNCLLTVSWLISLKYEMIYIKEEIYYVLLR